MSYSTSNFLIYSCFESKIRTGSTIGGSLLLDHADTEDEAKEKIQMYKHRAISYNSDNIRYTYIDNRPGWWH